MAVPKRQINAGGTAPLLLKLENYDTKLPVVADTLPEVKIIDPRGRTILSGADTQALGGGEYYYAHPHPVNTTKGFYVAHFSFTIGGIPLLEQVRYEVV